MGFDAKTLLDIVVNENASDLHIHVGESPVIRIDGSIMPIEGPVLTPEDTSRIIKEIISDKNYEKLEKECSVDFAYIFRDNCRFRVNAYKSKNNFEMVLRYIPGKMKTLEEIGIPVNIDHLLKLSRGLILVTGPTGCGKSTTLSAMVEWINSNMEGHIVTIEDPIEYYYNHKRCVISQRELGNDVHSFSSALRSALRQDPDIILVGEMRDRETIEAAITASETGHLVLSTLHTTGAARTVDRIIDVFPAENQNYIRTQLASNLMAVISQVLCRKKGAGRVAAYEVMIRTDAIGTLIRDNKTFRIPSEIQTGLRQGMMSLDTHLLSLYTKGIIDKEEALSYAQNPTELSKDIVDYEI